MSLWFQWFRAAFLSVGSDSFGAMSSGGVVDRDAITAAYDALDAAFDGVAALNVDGLTTRDWLALLERNERLRRRLPAVDHPVIITWPAKPPRRSWAASFPMRSPSGR